MSFFNTIRTTSCALKTITYVITFTFTHFLTADFPQLSHPKNPLTIDGTVHNIQFTPAIERFKGFELSLINKPFYVGNNTGLLFGFPVIGDYNPEGYNLRKRILLIDLNAQALSDVMPTSLKEALARELDIKSAKYRTFASLGLGRVLDAQHEPKEATYNIVYHPWVGLWHQADYMMNFFNENIMMGLFEPDGILEVGDAAKNASSTEGNVTFNAFSLKNVNWHAPEHMSPNNARFGIQPGREFSSFWAAAFSPDKQYVSITYVLLANTASAEHFLAQFANKAHTIRELDTLITAALTQAPFSNTDRLCVNHWLATLYRAATQPEGAHV